MTDFLKHNTTEISGQGFLRAASLLTPRLETAFGTIVATDRSSSRKGNILTRRVILRQDSTGVGLVEAELEIHCDTVPDALIFDLDSSDVPFGKLLMRYGIDSTMRALEFGVLAADGRAWRRNEIWHSDGSAMICRVYEIIAPDDVLTQAARDFAA